MSQLSDIKSVKAIPPLSKLTIFHSFVIALIFKEIFSLEFTSSHFIKFTFVVTFHLKHFPSLSTKEQVGIFIEIVSESIFVHLSREIFFSKSSFLSFNSHPKKLPSQLNEFKTKNPSPYPSALPIIENFSIHFGQTKGFLNSQFSKFQNFIQFK
jgi:hypothetical protein